jgi:hypothetical protein
MQMDSVRFTMLTLHNFLACFMLQMKSALKDLLMQAEERASQNMVLEALAAGSQEEVKMITKKLQLVKVGFSFST